MPNPVNWGILGPGRIARKFAKDLQLVPGARMHAVASRALDRAAAFAESFPAPHVFGSYAELVDCPELDVVYVASPHSGHHEHSLMLLEAGIPVLCEKPMAINSRQVKEMVSLARARNTFLMEAIWTRFLPSFLKAEEWVASGRIGELVSIKADFGFQAPFNPSGRLFNPALGGGALLDIGIYPVFLALHFLGRPRLIRSLAKLTEGGVDEEIGILFEHADGRMAHLQATLRARTQTEAWLYGTEGTLHLHTRWHETDKLTFLREGEQPEEVHLPMPGLGYYAEAREVMECLAKGDSESSLLPLDFSLSLMEVLDAIRAEAGIRYPVD